MNDAPATSRTTTDCPAGAVDSAPGSEPGGQRFESSAGRQLQVVLGTIKKMRNDFGDNMSDQYAARLAGKIVRNLETLHHGR